MARARDPNRNKAFEIYKKHGGKIDLVEIASQLNISPGTIRGWKSKDSWDTQLNGTLRKNTERSKRRKGGQPGNKNAEGHGGNGPPGNKNAVKTGEFETLFFDTLNPADFHSDLFFPLRQHAVEDTLHLEAFHIFYVLLL